MRERRAAPAADDAGARAVHEAAQAAIGRVLQLLDRARADAARRKIHHAREGGVVVGIRGKPQVGERVLDLLALEEAQPPIDAIRDAGAKERVLEDARLRVRAVEESHAGERRALAVQRFRFLDDEARLVVVVGRGVDAQRLALAFRGPEVLAEPRLVVRDDRVGRVEDVALRAVVLLELHHVRDSEVAHQLVHVADFGAAEAVDGLVVVAHREHAPVRAAQQLDPLVLQLVGVLELVDQDVAEAVLVVLQQVEVASQHLERTQHELGEVDHALAIALGVIIRVERDHAAGELVARLDGIGAQARFLGVVDEVLQLPRRVLLLVQALRLRQALDERLLVAGIEALEELRQPGVAEVRSQQAVAEAVERAHPHATRIDRQHRGEPREHLPRRLVGERDREDAARAGLSGFDQVGDAGGEHARLAATRAGEDERGLTRQRDGPELLGIETGCEAGHERLGDSYCAIISRREAAVAPIQ